MTARFHRDASAGEQLTYTATLQPERHRGEGIGNVAGSDGPVAEAEIMFAHVAPSQLPAGLTDTKFVFTGQLAHLLRQSGSQGSGDGVRGKTGGSDSFLTPAS